MVKRGRARMKELEQIVGIVPGEPEMVDLPPRTLKPFIAWDGEGITPPKKEYPPFDWKPFGDRVLTKEDWMPTVIGTRRNGKPQYAKFSRYDGRYSMANIEPAQDYVLFGCSTGDYRKSPSLSTEECFDLLLDVERKYPDAIHIGFSLRYDVNMMLKDLPKSKLMRIFESGSCHWKGYYIEYRPGKWIVVNRRGKNNKTSPTIKLFDVFGFFQCSFVKACEDLLGADDPELMAIREGKAARQSFTYDQLDSLIVPYMASELRMMVRLMDALRDSLLSAGMDLQSWHGAGAVASLILREQKVNRAMRLSPPEVTEAARYGYAGGRFEAFKCGYYKGDVYEYDIRSAYPSAMQKLPNLSRGVWRKTEQFIPDSFGIWRVSNTCNLGRLPMPLFRRHKEGMVSFPDSVQGWYWTPEVELISVESVEYGYVFEETDTTDRPFEFVGRMYETRARWKAEGNSAQMAYKLGLNSLYGKMAQRVGGHDDKAPPYHQLEWAGYVTSLTRAKIYQAAMQSPENIIAIETDALFSTVPLDLVIGTGLGEWEESRFDAICYIQSGVYNAIKGNESIWKYRGFDKDSLNEHNVSSHLKAMHFFNQHDCPNPFPLTGTTTRFIGFGIALHTSSVWRSWEVNKHRRVLVGGGGKRIHSQKTCPECRAKISIGGTFHTLEINAEGGESYPHNLPWIDEREEELLPWDELERHMAF